MTEDGEHGDDGKPETGARRAHIFLGWITEAREFIDTHGGVLDKATRKGLAEHLPRHRYGFRPKLEDPHGGEARDNPLFAELVQASRLMISNMQAFLVPRVHRDDLPLFDQELLNEIYSIDGDKRRVGHLYPKQLDDHVIARLEKQSGEVNAKLREFRRIRAACPDMGRSIAAQFKADPDAREGARGHAEGGVRA